MFLFNIVTKNLYIHLEYQILLYRIIYLIKMQKRAQYLSFLIVTAIFYYVFFASADNITISADVFSSLPVASGVLLNAGLDITLTANQTTLVEGTATITDVDGCANIQNVTATLFRANITGGTDAADDNRSHYSVLCTSLGDCAGGPDTTETYTCSYYMTWYADPTDMGALYEDTEWLLNVTPSDALLGTSDWDNAELQVLTAIYVDASSISFGLLTLGGNTSTANHNTTIENQGNEAVDLNIKGYGAMEGDMFCMECTTGNIDVDYLQYETFAFTYGNGQDLTDMDTEIDLDLDRGNETIPRPDETIYYGLGMPAAGVSGNCTGTIVLTSVRDKDLD